MLSGPPGPGGHVCPARGPRIATSKGKSASMASGAGGDREKRTLGQGRSAARRGGPYVAADEMRPVRRREGDRDEQRDERYRRRQLDDPRGAGEGDHNVITVGVVVESYGPGRVGRAGVGQRRDADQASQEQQGQRALPSHAAKPSALTATPSSVVPARASAGGSPRPNPRPWRRRPGVRSTRWPPRSVPPRRYGQTEGRYGPTRVPPRDPGWQRARRTDCRRGTTGGHR